MRSIHNDACAGVLVRAPALRRRWLPACAGGVGTLRARGRLCAQLAHRMLVALLCLVSGFALPVCAEVGAAPAATLADLLRAEDLAVPDAVRRVTDPPTRAQLRRFAEALRVLAGCRERADAQAFDRVRALLRSVNYEILSTSDGYWFLRDRLRARGMGSYALSRAPRDRLLVMAPKAFDEAYAAQAATALFYASGAQALAVAGAADPGGHDAPASHATFFDLFHRTYVRDDVLTVRGVAREVVRQRAWMPVGTSRLWVNRQPVSTSLDVAWLRERVGVLVVIGRGTPDADLRRDETPGAYVVLQLNRDDAAGLAVSHATHAAASAPWSGHAVRSTLDDWLRVDVERDAPRATRPAGFEREVLRPLVQLVEAGHAQGQWSPGALRQLQALHCIAGGADYGITRLREPKSRNEYVVLHPLHAGAASARYVLRAGGGDDYAVKVPDVAAEPHALEYGVRVFRELGARALIAGDDPRAPAKLRSNEAGSGIEPAFMTVVSRALPPTRMPHDDALLGFADGTMTREAASPLGERLLTVLRRAGHTYRLIDARTSAPPVASGEVATLWFMPRLSARGAAPAASGG